MRELEVYWSRAHSLLCEVALSVKQQIGRTDHSLQMSWLSLRKTWMQFMKTRGKLPMISEESIEYA
jgi:hypothetical protein